MQSYWYPLRETTVALSISVHSLTEKIAFGLKLPKNVQSNPSSPQPQNKEKRGCSTLLPIQNFISLCLKTCCLFLSYLAWMPFFINLFSLIGQPQLNLIGNRFHQQFESAVNQTLLHVIFKMLQNGFIISLHHRLNLPLPPPQHLQVICKPNCLCPHSRSSLPCTGYLPNLLNRKFAVLLTKTSV